MKKSDFYYDLPEELIAQTPEQKRSNSRMLVLNKETGEMEHKHFYDIVNYFKAGDCIVLNDSRVLPARLYGHRPSGTSVIEVVLLSDKGNDLWECITRPGKKTREGETILFGDGQLVGHVESVTDTGNRLIRFTYEGIFLEVLDQLGRMPLPPYITVELEDKERYQTVYSKNLGSAAAPTAGLHFTHEILDALQAKGVKIAPITLHVGLGTFRPVKADNIEEHIMHAEYYEISEASANIINETKQNGGRIFSVGTTSTRTVESVADEHGFVRACSGWTDIFIYPGYRFKCIDGLLTNFHLPESTLIMLVSTLAGYENTMEAYRVAVEERYRFFSFGDAMFIV